jgi:hypothetical protein
MKVDVEAFWRDGYQIVRDVYSPEEIAAFRRDAEASRSHGGDLLSNPLMRRALTDGRMLEVARTLLGSDEIVYAGDSSFTINSNQHGFHKDNADRDDPNAPDWQGRYTILRFGIYLQDHEKHSGGLNLRHASHNEVSLRAGKNVYVRTRVGDLAVWSLRTTHSGNGTLLTFPRGVDPEPGHNISRRFWWRPAKTEGDRMAVFAALGLDDAHHHRYVDYLKTRTYICDIWRRSSYDEEALAEAKASGLIVRDVPREIEGDETVGKNAAWAALPY